MEAEARLQLEGWQTALAMEMEQLETFPVGRAKRLTAVLRCLREITGGNLVDPADTDPLSEQLRHFQTMDVDAIDLDALADRAKQWEEKETAFHCANLQRLKRKKELETQVHLMKTLLEGPPLPVLVPSAWDGDTLLSTLKRKAEDTEGEPDAKRPRPFFHRQELAGVIEFIVHGEQVTIHDPPQWTRFEKTKGKCVRKTEHLYQDEHIDASPILADQALFLQHAHFQDATPPWITEKEGHGTMLVDMLNWNE